jgi:3-dehydro-4-phosphotetronate decarboxylase
MENAVMSAAIQTRGKESRLREQIVEFGRSLFERGLSAGSSGNISVRLDDGWLLTPTNASLGRLDPARLAKLDWSGRAVSGDAPSKEAFLHRAMYEERAGAGAIVHLHSTHSAAVSCMCGLNHDDCIPPLTAYFVMKIGRLPMIPYHRPGDPLLGEAIRKLARKHCAVLLANHGPVVSGTDLESAVYAAEELEETAKLFLLLRDTPTSPLNAAQIDELKSTFHLDI